MSLSYGFALRTADNSADFSDALHAVTGDGVAQEGGQLALSVNGFTVTLSTGYAFAAGRWVQNDEQYTMTIGPPLSNDNRTDAIVARVDYAAKTAGLEVIAGVDPSKIPGVLRAGTEYSIVLYLINVQRGATSLTPDDITDMRDNGEMCGRVVPLSKIAQDVFRVYHFLNGGIDDEVDRIVALSNVVIARASAAIAELDKTIQAAGGAPGIGELTTARHKPAEDGWLLCDGSNVPAGYTVLNTMLSGTLPDISTATDRYRTYIYGGTPTAQTA